MGDLLHVPQVAASCVPHLPEQQSVLREQSPPSERQVLQTPLSQSPEQHPLFWSSEEAGGLIWQPAPTTAQLVCGSSEQYPSPAQTLLQQSLFRVHASLISAHMPIGGPQRPSVPQL
jgi:hypothetical protein